MWLAILATADNPPRISLQKINKKIKKLKINKLKTIKKLITKKEKLLEINFEITRN